MSLRPVTGAPASAIPDEAPPELVRAAVGKRPLKRSPAAVRERQKKRDQRAAKKEIEILATPAPALEVVLEQPCTPADAAMLISAIMGASALVTGRHALKIDEREALECGKALAPVIDKWGAAVVSKFVLELHAIQVCASVLTPHFAKAFAEPELPPPAKEGGPAAATA